MNLKKMTNEELEILSYTDLTALILKEENIPMNTPTIFKKICELLDYSDEAYMDKIGDYYTSLTIDKRFVFLDSNEWDLREKHSVSVMLDDDEIDEADDEEVEEEEEKEEEDIDDEITDDDLDDFEDVEDGLEDLAIISEEELEN